ncbi:MAG: RND transporter, partial [Bacteroidetes bacterium]|nr:RND transporter [Bacteroidota bacterium]
MKKNKIYIYAAIIVGIIILIWFYTRTKSSEIETIKVPVKFGKFQINVTTTGELEAKNSEKILGPSNLRTVRIWQLTIEDIIPDGTVVDSGEYVATLDRTELSNRIKDVETELEKLESQYIKTQLDTSMELRNARNELINLEYNLEEIHIELEQSIYEPPSTIRQIKISLDKAQRALEQATSNYKLKYKRAKATMQE